MDHFVSTLPVSLIPLRKLTSDSAGQRVGQRQTRSRTIFLIVLHIALTHLAHLDRYHSKILDRLHTLKSTARSLSRHRSKSSLSTLSKKTKTSLCNLLSLLSSFIHAIVPPAPDSSDEEELVWPDHEDEAEEAEEMTRLKYEWAEIVERGIAERLEGTTMDDPPSLISVLGQPRLELVGVPSPLPCSSR